MRTLLRRKFCKCGCGQQITSKRKGVEFIWGHHSRCMSDEIIQKRANSIKKSYEHRDGYWKGKKRPLETGIKIAEAHRGMKYRVKVKLLRRKLCACGCGQFFVPSRRQYKCIRGHTSEETREKLVSARIGCSASFKKGESPWNKGLKSPETSERNKLKWEDPEYREHMINVLTTISKERWQDPEYRKHMSNVHVESSKEMWANRTIEEKQKIVDKMRLYMSGTIGSSIEQKITNEAKKNNFVFYNNHRIGKYFADLYFPNYKMVVECDGKYWHGLPSAWMKDGKRDFWFRNNGYRVVR